ncbi:hypothetical protein GCM10023088_07820 [Actinomadura verrucosospora]
MHGWERTRGGPAAPRLHRDHAEPPRGGRDFTHVTTWASVVYIALVVVIFLRAPLQRGGPSSGKGRPGGRVDAVGANQDVRACVRAVGEPGGHGPGVLLEAD